MIVVVDKKKAPICADCAHTLITDMPWTPDSPGYAAADYAAKPKKAWPTCVMCNREFKETTITPVVVWRD